MARKVPKLAIDSVALGIIGASLAPAPRQGKEFAIFRCSDNVIVRSCSGKSRFPTRAAALCALSHTLAEIAQCHVSSADAVDAAQSIARRGGSLGPKWAKILMRAVLDAGVVKVDEA